MHINIFRPKDLSYLFPILLEKNILPAPIIKLLVRQYTKYFSYHIARGVYSFLYYCYQYK